MKNYSLLLIFSFLVLFFSSCKENNEDKPIKRPVFDASQSFLKASFGNEYWDKPIDSLGTFYARIKDDSSFYGTDIVASSEDINSSATTNIAKYIFIHIDSASFYTKQAPIKVIYYTNRTISDDGHQIYGSYFVNISNDSVNAYFNEDSTLSGYYIGNLQNAMNTSDIRKTKIEFNRIPVKKVE
ncbi:MAG: hypothetical protein HUK18_03365 [Bacteroidales bacterium]|nr:hypothetical protein [Bacteroidales bacterium]